MKSDWFNGLLFNVVFQSQVNIGEYFLQVVYYLTLVDNFIGRIQLRREEIQENMAPSRVGFFLAQLAHAAQDVPISVQAVVPNVAPHARIPGLLCGLDENNIIPEIDRLRRRN